MKNNNHIETQFVTFICASCGNKHEIKSSLKNKEQTVDICSLCHPFYSGESSNQQIRGRAEQFNKKLSTMGTNQKTTKKTEVKKSNKKIVKSLDSL